MVAGQHQVIAVVDDLFERGVEIRTAAPARLTGQFDEFDLEPGLCKRHGGGQPREPGADDIRFCSTHPASPCLSTIIRSSALPIFARLRGGTQPCFSILDRMVE